MSTLQIFQKNVLKGISGFGSVFVVMYTLMKYCTLRHPWLYTLKKKISPTLYVFQKNVLQGGYIRDKIQNMLQSITPRVLNQTNQFQQGTQQESYQQRQNERIMSSCIIFIIYIQYTQYKLALSIYQFFLKSAVIDGIDKGNLIRFDDFLNSREIYGKWPASLYKKTARNTRSYFINSSVQA